jgi:hypothetical protein
MKVSINEFKDIVQDAIQNGFFEEVTEDILNDDSEFNTLFSAFVNELRKKKVIRGKKLKLKVICPKNKKYVAAKKQCVTKTAREKVRKRRAMKRGAMKKRGKMGKIVRKRKKSMKKRKGMGLK